jgi:hypothetical protein
LNSLREMIHCNEERQCAAITDLLLNSNIAYETILRIPTRSFSGFSVSWIILERSESEFLMDPF